MPLRLILQRKRPYVYIWNRFEEQYLPEHYKRRCLEYMSNESSPVHWRPDPRKHQRLKNGVVVPVQNVPINPRYPKICNDGLWGGEGVLFGMTKKKPMKRRVPKIWLPFLTKRALYSEILDKWFGVTVTLRALDLIDDAYGLDSYLLETPEWELNSKLAMKLKRELLLALAKKSLYPNDEVKREKIYKKYEKFIIPEEEAEWLGLSVEEAVEKGKKIEESKRTPLLDLLTDEFIEQFKDQKLKDQDEKGGLFGKFSIYKKTPEDESEKR